MITHRPLNASRCREQRRAFPRPTADTSTVLSDDTDAQIIDWFAIERVINNDQPLPYLNNEEIRIAALHLRRNDMARRAVSEYLRVYERRIKEWEADAGLLGPEDLCTLNDCARASAGRGLCANHLQQQRTEARRQRRAAEAAQLEVAA